MPQLKIYSPDTLEDLCLSTALRCLETDLLLCEIAKGMAPSSLLLTQVDLSMTKIADKFAIYLSCLSGTLSEMVRQQLTTRVLSKYIQPVNTHARNTSGLACLPLHTMTLRLLEIVLNEDVHEFDLSAFQPALCTLAQRPALLEPFLWTPILNRCFGLRKFALPPSISKLYNTVELDSFMVRLAVQCSRLTEVILKDGVHDGKVLAAFGAHCPSLRVIDISGSSVVCNDILYLVFPDIGEADWVSNGEKKIKKTTFTPTVPKNYFKSELCGTLKELIISDTKVKSLGVYYALKYMPHLESLGECHHVLNALKKRRLKCSTATFKLKHVRCCGLDERMNVVCATCPDLEALYIGSRSTDQFTFQLPSLRKFPHLRSLTLESNSSLDLTGLRFIQRLVYLKLLVPEADVGEIAEACPALEQLIISSEPKITFTLSEQHDKLPLFQNLRELQVDCPMLVNIAAFIITKATLLQTVKLIRIKKLTDKILSRWLDVNPLVHLQTWLLTYGKLTVESVTLLLTRCSKISTIGRLCSWDVRSWELRRLERTWKGYDVNLVLFSHKQDVAQIMDATVSSDEEEE